MLAARDQLTRLRWCKEGNGWPLEMWKQIIFSDESNFKLMNRKNKVLVKRFKPEKYNNRFVVPRLQSGSGSVGIWGCFNFNVVGVCNIYTGRINQHTYIEMLENCMVPSVGLLINRKEWWQFQQDMAPAHSAHKVTDERK